MRRCGVTKVLPSLANNNGNRHVCLHFQMEFQSLHDRVGRLPGVALDGRVFRIQTREIEIPRLDTLRSLIAAPPSSQLYPSIPSHDIQHQLKRRLRLFLQRYNASHLQPIRDPRTPHEKHHDG
ncbi:hypothetical protein K0M31_009586 [Melipona bicolor]|uniref:Uncharacterized protein n=1 Tax=Melipona bicolor TaxID=60889 RepID=A0AA40FP58_9HYME|nr:hypothetical protein K0M31_009586 [Melipona bicolor]